ncbi:hypothetical protein E4U41_004796, partial [Claviceps citrina]
MSLRRSAAAAAASAAMLITSTSAQQDHLCASINTASTEPTTSIYQSVGACTASCGAGFAFAVLQNHLCWCTNFAPGASTRRDGGCRAACPGYPADVCGNGSGSGGLYSYVVLDASLVEGTREEGGDGAAGRATTTSAAADETSSPAPPPASASASASDSASSGQTTPAADPVHTVTVQPTDLLIA